MFLSLQEILYLAAQKTELPMLRCYITVSTQNLVFCRDSEVEEVCNNNDVLGRLHLSRLDIRA